MKKYILVLFLSFILTFTISSLEFSDYLEQAVNKLAPAGNNSITVSLGNFYMADKSISTEFSIYLSENIELALTVDKHFNIFAKDRLDEIFDVQKLSISGIMKKSSEIDMGELQGLQAVLSGRYFERGSKIEIYLELLDIKSGTTQKAKIDIPRRTVPASIALVTHDFSRIVERQDYLDSLMVEDDFTVWLDLNRGKGGVYNSGEELHLVFASNNDCYILIWSIDQDNNKVLIFPNKWQKDNFIKAEQWYTMPDKRKYGNFKFRIGTNSKEPVCETVLLQASTKQFNNLDELVPFNITSDEIFSRLITVEAAETETANIKVDYTILP